MQAWADDMDLEVCPVTSIQRKAKPIQLVLALLQELPEGVAVLNQPPNRVTTLDFTFYWG